MRKLLAVNGSDLETIDLAHLRCVSRDSVFLRREEGSFRGRGFFIAEEPFHVPELIQDELGAYVLIFRKKGEGE